MAPPAKSRIATLRRTMYPTPTSIGEMSEPK